MFLIDVSDLIRAGTAFLSALSRGARAALHAEASETRARIVGGAYWTNRTGRTAQSFRIEQSPEGLGASLVSPSKVARLLNDGTRAHPINARRRGAMRFVQNGHTTFARRVQHPGTKARRFEEIEAANAEPRAAAGVERAAEAAAALAGID